MIGDAKHPELRRACPEKGTHFRFDLLHRPVDHAGQRIVDPSDATQPRADDRAYSTRRPTVPASAQAAIAGGAPNRERASFVPPLESDWHTPAFQRRGQ